MCKILLQIPFEQTTYTFKNKGKEGKTSGDDHWEGRRKKGRMKEGEYGQCSLYMCMKLKQ
jgi:hypothetical protein